MGTNALPKLLQIIHSRKPGLRESLLNWGVQHGLARYFRINVVDLHYQSVIAFKCLGKQAGPAIPELSSLLNRGLNPGYTSTALAMLGEAGRKELIRYFNHPNLAVRRCSAAALSTVKDQAELQLPLLIQACPTADAYGRSVVAEALGWHTNQPALALPVLLGLVQDPAMDVRRAAVNSLSAYGAQASNALPFLRELIKGPPTDLTLPALNALNKIEGLATHPIDQR
jgi:HEAT repeat protein